VKIAPRDIAAFLASPKKAKAVLIYGPDEGLVAERGKALLSKLLANPQDPLSKIHLSQDKIFSQPTLLHEALASMSLLGEPPVVVVQHASDKLSGILKDAFKHGGEQNHLIVCAGDLPSRSSLRDLFEKEKMLAAIPCYRDEGASLEQVIQGALRGKKIIYDRDTLIYLVGQLGNDRSITRNELEKIDVYLGEERTLTLETATLIVEGNKNISPDDLCHAVAEGKTSLIPSLLQSLFADGHNPIALTRWVSRHFEKLCTAKSFMLQGIPADQAIERLRPPVFFKYKPSFKKQLERLTEQRLSRNLASMLEMERKLKHSGDQEIFFLQSLTLLSAV